MHAAPRSSWLLFVVAAQLAAQSPLPGPNPRLDPAEFRAHREALATAIAKANPQQRALVVVRGGAAPADMGAFVQDQDFLYLSGVAEPGLALLLAIDERGKLVQDQLLVPPHSPFTAKWDGSFLAPGAEAAGRTGFATVGNVRALAATLKTLLAPTDGSQPPLVFTLLQAAPRLGSTPGRANDIAEQARQDALDGRTSREGAFAATLQRDFPAVQVRGLESFLHALRPRKSAAEVAVITRCAQIAAAGLGEAMRRCAPGQYEYQLAAVARFVFSLNGCGPDAYAAIVGAGANGCVLHYNQNQKSIDAKDLIVMDYAPTLAGYATDVTRTFPASGKFSPEQRKLVQDVYDIQQALLAEVKPGAKLSAIGAKCAQMLQERGYRSDHGPCHHVGLAVHDPHADVLEAGMVITVEPGAYLHDKGMGCRIEDTVLVTADGCLVLSKDVPSAPDAIELWMAKQPPTGR